MFITLLIAPAILLLHYALPCVCQCNLTDSYNHICLHTFLERDFPLIEEMANKPNFIREGGMEFEEMCE